MMWETQGRLIGLCWSGLNFKRHTHSEEESVLCLKYSAFKAISNKEKKDSS